MCGIIGIVGPQPVAEALIAGLRLLEYRGYDSAGIAIIDAPTEGRIHESQIHIYKEVGPVSVLADALPTGLPGHTGLAHTRWATHGGVTRENAHPHTDGSGRVAIVHNGILDDARRLRAGLVAEGAALASDTDSEVLAWRIAAGLDRGLDPVGAVRAALRGLRGTWGLVVAFADHPGMLVAARMGSPLAIGLGEGETLVASDPQALVRHARRVIFLEDGDLAVLKAGHAVVQRLDGAPCHPAVVELDPAAFTRSELSGFSTFMAQEIHEQPEALARCLAGRLRPEAGEARLGGFDLRPPQVARLPGAVLLGCGTSLHAAEVGVHLLERLARLPTRAEQAGEHHARGALVDPEALHLALSQSGETWDTLAAVKEVQRRGGTVHGLINSVGSTLARTCGAGTYLHAGPEVAVASTKAFTSQVAALALLALSLGRTRHLSLAEGQAFARALAAIPDQAQATLEAVEGSPALARATRLLACAPHVVVIGRGPSWAVAREGALKLEELTWKPARACAGAELKHGPLALLDEEVPVVAVLPDDEHRQAMLATLEEIAARGAPLVVIHTRGNAEAAALATVSLPIPAASHGLLSPLLTVLPLQLLARDVALALGREVDRPRNLAKAVTVA